MARLGIASLVVAAWVVAALPAGADATLTCDFKGRTVRAIVTNSKDGPRTCNAWCVWYYGKVSYQGAGGASLATGETATVYNSIAPVKIDGLAGSNLNCNR